MRFTRRFLGLAAVAVAPAVVSAQTLSTAPAALRPPRGAFGVNFSVAQPVGEFSNYVKNGFGGNAYGVLNLDRRGILGIRLDGEFLNYGNEKKRVPLSNTVGGRIMVDLTTSNNIVDLGIGPQLTVPGGPVRPYIAGTIGAAYFVTQSSVEGSNNNNQPFASTTNKQDWTFAYTGSGGLLIPVYQGKNPVSIDLGARYHGNGKVSYLRKGGITDNPDGTIDLNVIRSEANLVTYHIGVHVGLR